MRIILQQGYTKEELLEFKETVYVNIIKNMKSLVDAVKRFNYPLSSEENEKRAARVAAIEDNMLLSVNKVWSSDLAKDIEHLWSDDSIKKAYKRKNEFQIGDSAEYYFNDLARINMPDYVPTLQDALRTRLKTTGIVETTIKFDDYTVKVIDVGGQRNERKKWIHCFDGVTVVIFVVSLSEFDQKCYEDDTTNRLQESLHLFEETINNKWFINTPFLLYMNKMDLFKEKCETVDLSTVFEDYTGGKKVEEASKFLCDKYLSLNKNKDRPVHVFCTTATDSETLRSVFMETKKLLLSLPTKKIEL
jgi:GTPase SAR1 family protein